VQVPTLRSACRPAMLRLHSIPVLHQDLSKNCILLHIQHLDEANSLFTPVLLYLSIYCCPGAAQA
jgi:hypothetical protein